MRGEAVYISHLVTYVFLKGHTTDFLHFFEN